MFADDIALYKAIARSEDVVALQADVTMVELWAESRDLRMNARKTKSLVISRKRKPPVLHLTLCGAEIEQVSTFKYLGVTIADDLSWNVHVAGVCSRARRMLGFMYTIFGRGADPKALEHLFKSMVLPILDYGTPHILPALQNWRWCSHLLLGWSQESGRLHQRS